MSLVTFNLPDTRAHVRLVWKITGSGTDVTNDTPIPSVIGRRTVFIKCVSGQGTITLEGGYHVPESAAGTFWDTILSQTVSNGTTIYQNLQLPYHFYRPSFTPQQGYQGSIEIWVVIEGNA